MNTPYTKLKKLFSSKLFHSFPSEMILCLIAFISLNIALFFNNSIFQWAQEKLPEDMSYLYWWFAIVLPLTYFLNLLSKKVTALKYLYFITPFLFVLGYFIPLHTIKESYLSAFLLTPFLSITLLLIQFKEWNNKRFAKKTMHLTQHLALSTLLGIISILALVFINITIFSIFFSTSNPAFDKLMATAVGVGVLLCGPYLFFYFRSSDKIELENQKENKVNEENRFYNTLINYIWTPALIVYSLIILIYAIQCLLKGTLPEGLIANLMLGFLIALFIGRLINHSINKSKFAWFYKFTPTISLLPIILLYISLYIRVDNYGWTEMRIYLFIIGTLLSISLLLITRIKYLGFLILSWCSIAFSCYISPISAKHLGIISQRKQLEKTLQELEQNKWYSSYAILREERKTPKDTLRYKLQDNAISIFKYLKTQQDTIYIAKAYDTAPIWLSEGMWEYRDKHPEQTKKLRKVRIFTIGKYRFAAEHYNKYKDEILKRTPALCDYIEYHGNWLAIGSDSTVWMRMIDKDSCLIDKYIPLSELLKMK